MYTKSYVLFQTKENDLAQRQTTNTEVETVHTERLNLAKTVLDLADRHAKTKTVPNFDERHRSRHDCQEQGL